MMWKWPKNAESKTIRKRHEHCFVTFDRNFPIQITLSIYTFKYTHTTLGFTTQWRMRWWMLIWVNGYGHGDDDSDDTDYDGAITPVFSPDTIIRRFTFSTWAFWMIQVCRHPAQKLFCTHISFRPYYITLIINEINMKQILMIYERNIIILKDNVVTIQVLKLHL